MEIWEENSLAMCLENCCMRSRFSLFLQFHTASRLKHQNIWEACQSVQAGRRYDGQQDWL